MKRLIIFFTTVSFCFIVALTTACTEEDPEPGRPPFLTTINISSVSPTSISTGGIITSDGGSKIKTRGLCWNTLPNPTIFDNSTEAGSGTGIFKIELSGLTPTTTYYIRAFATNSVTTSYGNELFVKTPSGIIDDIEGNVYNFISIGSQKWMAENLKTTRYNDNTPVPLVEENIKWAALNSPGYCWYDNDSAVSKSVYGALYNWYAVDSIINNGKNICPAGWHVPTDSDWLILVAFLGGDSIAGGKMKESGTVHWNTPNTGATNESGFTGLSAGGRLADGRFRGVKTRTGWWTSTELFPGSARGRYLYYEYSLVYRGSGIMKDGFSVRCLMD